MPRRSRSPGRERALDPAVLGYQPQRKATDERTAEQANAQDAYAAFGNKDAEGALRDLDDSIAWTEGGDNALTGTHDGKQAVGELWGKLMSEGFRTLPHDFVAEGDKVVVLTTRELGGEATEGADVLTFNDAGRLVTFEALGDTTQLDRVFAK